MSGLINRKPMLMSQAVLLANEEAQLGTDSIEGESDSNKRDMAILIGEPDFSIDPTTNQRNIVKPDISPQGMHVGRKLNSVTFTAELRGNGAQNDGATTPRLARLFKACGFTVTAMTAAASKIDVIPGPANTGGKITWTKAGSPSNTLLGMYKTKIMKAGGTNVARIRVTGGIHGTDTYIGQNEDVKAWVIGSYGSETSISVDDTDPFNVKIIMTGNPIVGDIINISILGRDISYTIRTTDPVVELYSLTEAINAQSKDLFRAQVGDVDREQDYANLAYDALNSTFTDPSQDFSDWAQAATATHKIKIYNTNGSYTLGFMGAASGVNNRTIQIASSISVSGNNGFEVDGSAGVPVSYEVFEVDTVDEAVGSLSQSSTTFTDTGQDFTDYQVSAGSNATHVLLVRNTDGTYSIAYIGDGVGGGPAYTQVNMYSDYGTTSAGWIVDNSSKTPQSYYVMPVSQYRTAAGSAGPSGTSPLVNHIGIQYWSHKNITIANDTYTAGETVSVTVLGQTFTWTASAGETQDDAATGLAALIDAVNGFTAAADGTTANQINILFYDTSNNHYGLGAHSHTEIASGESIYLGNSGAAIQPTFPSSDPDLNDYYIALVGPTGFKMKPCDPSDAVSLTLWFYLEGILHKMSGCLGTFTINADAGSFGTFSFTFTGNYAAPVNSQILSSPNYEQIVPPQIELANCYYDFFRHLKAQTFTFDMSNEIVPRSDVNSEDGYNGVYLPNRTPSGGLDPEMIGVYERNLWDDLSSGKYLGFHMRFGKNAGNTIWIASGSMQLSNNAYQDRDNIRTLGQSFSFARSEGNDEVLFYFT